MTERIIIHGASSVTLQSSQGEGLIVVQYAVMRKNWKETALDDTTSVYEIGCESPIVFLPIGFLWSGDTFTKEVPLWKYDSWSFSDGQEKLNDFVREHGLNGEHPDWTTMDFVNWYVEAIKKGKHR